MVLFRGDIKCKSLQRRTSISVILPADNIHFLQDTEEIVPQPYRTLYLLHGLYGSDDIFLANTSIQKFAEDNGIAVVIPCGENSFYVDNEKAHAYYGEYVGQELLDITSYYHLNQCFNEFPDIFITKLPIMLTFIAYKSGINIFGV